MKVIPIRLSDQLLSTLDSLAKIYKVSRSELIRSAIQDYLRNYSIYRKRIRIRRVIIE